MGTHRIIVIGAGIGGLAASLDLARAGFDVVLLEAEAAVGGKMREIRVGDAVLDGGPTVFTMRWVFDALFADAGTTTERELTLAPLDTLARHAWADGSRLDLHADFEHSVDAIGRFAGRAAAHGYRTFCARAEATFKLLDASFIRVERPSAAGMMLHAASTNPGDVLRIKPYATLWRALGEHFDDPRLRQLFGRYATYTGSSPFLASATLMLIAHVERLGVYALHGGMHQLALALARVAARNGAVVRCGAKVDSIEADRSGVSGVRLATGEFIAARAVIFNGDTNALASGRLGPVARAAVGATPHAARSQSAVTLAMLGRANGFELSHHSVFFSNNSAAEFDDVFRRGRVPAEPTVYVCAQDRGQSLPAGDAVPAVHGAPERLFCLINAPARGDGISPAPEEIASCQSRIFQQLARCGLSVEAVPGTTVTTSPWDFERLFPATGGALYGPVSHGWMAPFQRPSSRSRIAGLYLAGGSCHPGAGVPMATLSGRLAARAVTADRASIWRSSPVAMPGGTSTR